MYNGYVESAASIEARRARICGTSTIKTTGSKFQQALATASRLLQAKQIRDQRNKALCVCLQYIGDNGPCPVHGPGLERQGQ